MFQRILVPLDGSQIAEIALPYAEELAKGLETEVLLFHACGSEDKEHEHMHLIYLESMARTLSGQMKKETGADSLKVSIKLEAGGPQGTICNLVEQNDVSLIIMTATGAGINVKMLGSVAAYVCRNSPVPVLLIRPQSQIRETFKKKLITNILLPLDGSVLSQSAIPVAEEIALKLSIPVTLFEMAPMSYSTTAAHLPGIDFQAIDYSRLDQNAETLVRADLDRIERKLRQKGLIVSSRSTSGVNAANDIIEAGKEIHADLIVMSTRGKSGLNRWALGSVAETVLNHSGIPVLLVNARAG